MIHPGEAIREAEFRKKEFERELAHRQNGRLSDMLHPGDSTYEAEHRMKEAERILGQRQVGGMVLRSSRLRFSPRVRERYYRQLARIGRRTCELGWSLGCTLECRALAHRPAVPN